MDVHYLAKARIDVKRPKLSFSFLGCFIFREAETISMVFAGFFVVVVPPFFPAYKRSTFLFLLSLQPH